MTVYFDVSSASDLSEEDYPPYTSQRENAVIVISNAPNDKFFLSFGKGFDDGVFSESIGHRLRAPAVRDDVFPRLKAMFRFRKLLGTPKSVNGEKWGTRKEPESTIEVSFHSVGRKNGQVKVEEGITIPWPKETTIQSFRTHLGYKAEIKVREESSSDHRISTQPEQVVWFFNHEQHRHRVVCLCDLLQH